ncbi:hypothetical protein CPB83DRAFT_836654 [Crepidotus variabilis]|uniref:Uncharacterized protein n=1 Tax=Crepidotus variabilis TaxID=179855 RepID=A0A9P6EE57_9AGAR|nr:hypothetical protein CPB83DRAFT_836654 [Crepidotus variabilis]
MFQHRLVKRSRLIRWDVLPIAPRPREIDDESDPSSDEDGEDGDDDVNNVDDFQQSSDRLNEGSDDGSAWDSDTSTLDDVEMSDGSVDDLLDDEVANSPADAECDLFKEMLHEAGASNPT